jgi:hypothetical protein
VTELDHAAEDLNTGRERRCESVVTKDLHLRVPLPCEAVSARRSIHGSNLRTAMISVYGEGVTFEKGGDLVELPHLFQDKILPGCLP